MSAATEGNHPALLVYVAICGWFSLALRGEYIDRPIVLIALHQPQELCETMTISLEISNAATQGSTTSSATWSHFVVGRIMIGLWRRSPLKREQGRHMVSCQRVRVSSSLRGHMPFQGCRGEGCSPSVYMLVPFLPISAVLVTRILWVSDQLSASTGTRWSAAPKERGEVSTGILLKFQLAST